ncbi:MAG: class E sortase [Propionibacteriaceae bacterium]|jgi:sortase A|nr:class E sortase [Propionibacteriaceae bacterium]
MARYALEDGAAPRPEASRPARRSLDDSTAGAAGPAPRHAAIPAGLESIFVADPSDGEDAPAVGGPAAGGSADPDVEDAESAAAQAGLSTPETAAEAQPGSEERKGANWYVREAFGLLGELLVTAGAFLLLFVGWELFWTDVVADMETDQVIAQMEAAVAAGTAGSDTSEWVAVKAKKLGDAFAIIRIPRFGKNYAKPIREGTGREILRQGVGHYSSSQDPGEVGNFAVAGHRTTYGKPFNKIDKLQPGDKVIIETAETFFIYEIYDHEIVKPSQGEVIWPVPGVSDGVPTEALLTMTSCNPEYSSRERYVQHGKLVATYTNEGELPAEVLEV